MSSAENMRDFLKEVGTLDEEAFLAAYPYPFLVRESTRAEAVPVPAAGRGTMRLSKRAIPTSGDGFMSGEVFIHRVYPRNPEGESVTIGRDESCDLVIEDGSISGVHAEFTLEFEEESKRFFLRDLGSANGTFINGDVAEGVVEVEAMDSIRLGPAIKLQFFDAPGFYQFLSMYRRIK